MTFRFQVEPNAYSAPWEFVSEIEHDGQECELVKDYEEAFDSHHIEIRFADGVEVTAHDYELEEL